MSDPMTQRPIEPPHDGEPRRRTSPLIWVLLLIALIAVGWYFYNRQAGTDGSLDIAPPAPVGDAMTPAPGNSAEKEPIVAAKPKPRAVAKATAPSRDATLIAQPAPKYPTDAYRNREEGTVVVTAQVDALGNPGDVEISKRSGSRTLDRAAMAEVRKWKFTPALKNGKPVASSVQVPVEYRLDEQ